MSTSREVPRSLRIAAGWSMLAFPALLLFGFLAHPNLLAMDHVTSASELAARFRGNVLFHVGHLVVMFSVIPIVVTGIWMIARVSGTPGQRWGVGGALVGLFGAFILTVDKGALTLTLSAFDTLPDDQFAGVLPGLQSLIDRRGALALVYLLPALPLGFAAASVGLLRARAVPRWQGIAQIVGALLLANPDIDLVSAVGSAVMCLGYWPLGLSLLREKARAP